jgi:energy-coupling factor transport system permease protein
MTELLNIGIDRQAPMARVDFRAKLALLVAVTAVAFLWDRPLCQLVLALLLAVGCWLGGLRMKYMRLMFKIMFPFYVLLLITHGFFNVAYVKSLTKQAALTPLFQFPANYYLIGGAGMTREGLLFGVNAVLKTVTLMLVAPLVIFTTPVDGMVTGLVRARVPYKIAFIFAATLRFFPLLLSDIGAIIDAQRLRGIAVEKMNLLGRIRIYARVAVPLCLGAMARSQQLEVVLQAKAFSGSPDRTYLHEPRLRTADVLLMVFSLLFLIGAFAMYFTVGLGRFTGRF